MAFLFARFVVGAVTFSTTVGVLYVSVIFVTTSIYYDSVRLAIGLWEIDTLGNAFALLPIGLAGLVIVPHLVNAQVRAIAPEAPGPCSLAISRRG